MGDLAIIEAKFQALSGRLDEATLRIWAATEARSLGRGGVSAVAKAIGMSRTTIHAGLAELKARSTPAPDGKRGARLRIRAAGGGRKKLIAKDADLLRDLDALVEPMSRGDPMSPLRWTCKSTYRLADELQRLGHEVSQRTVCDLLAQLDYSLQSTRKTREGGQHEDRDAQFAHIAKQVTEYQAEGEPVISVDTKKKELIGDFKNAGREWQVVVNLIGSTTTREGLRIKAGIDENAYAKGVKVSDEELAALAIEGDAFHGEGNYRLLPRTQRVWL